MLTVTPVSVIEVIVPLTARAEVLVRSTEPTALGAFWVDCPVQYQADDSASVDATNEPGLADVAAGGDMAVPWAMSAMPPSTTTSNTKVSHRRGSP